MDVDRAAGAPDAAGLPPWTVALVCGASGVGKTSAARALASRHDAALGEADDIVTAIKALTTSSQLPAVHLWDGNPQAAQWPPARIAELHFSVAEELRPAFRAVIADHVAYAARVVFEGDYLTPELAAGFGAAVRAVVLADEESGIAANLLAREPGRGAQDRRAAVNALVGAELAARARAAGVPVLPARPWPGSVERIEAALRRGGLGPV